MKYFFDLIIHLVKRDFNITYKGSYLGILWSLVFPVLQVSVYIFVFTYVIPLGIEGYPGFIFCALLGWNWFSSSLFGSSNLYLFNKDTILKPGFKPYLLNIVLVLSNLLLFILALPVLLIILLYYDKFINLSILNLPIVLMVQFMFTIGISLIISILNVIYRDVQQLLNLSLILLFYLSSVFYSKDMVGDDLKIFFDINPVAVLVESYRDILFYGKNPDYLLLAYVLLLSAAILYIGVKLFKRNLNYVIDRL